VLLIVIAGRKTASAALAPIHHTNLDRHADLHKSTSLDT
jgi:hypothetical protein